MAVNPTMTNPVSPRTIIALLFLSAAAYSAGDPAGFHVWKPADIDAIGKRLATKLDANKIGSESITKVGNRAFSVTHREGSGQAELHAKQADIMVIQSGNATLTYGGEVVNGKTSAPDEIRGTSIKGGSEIALAPGDVVHIPAKTPHQMKLAPGQQLTYFVVKVTE